MILVTENGFQPIAGSESPVFIDIEELDHGSNRADLAIELPVEFDIETLTFDMERIAHIRIPFASFADGRGFSLARQLRLKGFTGRLRASGHVLADQFHMALRCGFDEVEISEDLAERQPEDQWISRISQSGFYQPRLMPAA